MVIDRKAKARGGCETGRSTKLPIFRKQKPFQFLAIVNQIKVRLNLSMEYNSDKQFIVMQRDSLKKN